MSSRDKPLVWLRGEVKTPPFGADARIEAGFLLRRLCHELRIVDGHVNWRIMYYIAADAIVILDVFQKKTEGTPKAVIASCQRRLADFMKLTQPKKGAGHARR